MCSISGFTWEDKSLIKDMNNVLSYRGPDDSGIFLDSDISLGHNRLSIIDLSKAGHQPMSNKNGTLWIIYNGEIYNFKEIRKVLERKGYVFFSNTDTEVILYAYEEYGAKCLELFNGMFAFAIWDTENKELFLARDRIGIKPLYYLISDKNLIFSSEIKGIIQYKFKKEIDLESLNSYLTFKFIPFNRTMVKRIRKLLPGYYAIFKDGKISIKKYWNIEWKLENLSFEYFLKRINELLLSSVNYRLISDVPLGAYLSGGLDSSLIVAINSKLRKNAVNTFTVGYGEVTDELKYANKVSDYLSTNHHELILDYKNITRNIPTIIWHMDDPNSDITMVPIYFLSKFSKEKITVINTGEGPDELFSGYPPYKLGADICKPIPTFFKKFIYKWYYSPFKHRQKMNLFNILTNKMNYMDSYFIKSHSKQIPDVFLNKLLNFDIKNELPNLQLARMDRMAMAHSMEARVPFLDHRIVELSVKLPTRFKQYNFTGKYILKKLALKYLPKEIVYRKKQAFTTPMHSWIKDSLEDIIESILFDNKKAFFNYDNIKKLILKHKKSKKQLPFIYNSFQLLTILFLDIWYEIYINNNSIQKFENLLKI